MQGVAAYDRAVAEMESRKIASEATDDAVADSAGSRVPQAAEEEVSPPDQEERLLAAFRACSAADRRWLLEIVEATVEREQNLRAKDEADSK